MLAVGFFNAGMISGAGLAMPSFFRNFYLSLLFNFVLMYFDASQTLSQVIEQIFMQTNVGLPETNFLRTMNVASIRLV